MSGGGGGSGNDGSNDTQVSGAEAFYSNEPGVSTYAESKVTQSSGSGAPGGGDRNMYYDAPDTSMVGAGGGNVDAEDEYDEPDAKHFNQTQKEIRSNIKDLKKSGQYDVKMSDDEYKKFNEDLNKYYGTENVKYEPYGRAGQGTVNLSFSEHFDNLGHQYKALRFSPVLRFLAAAGKNINEYLTTDYGTGKYGGAVGSGSGPAVDGGGLLGSFRSGGSTFTPTASDRDIMRNLAPEAPYIVSGTQKPTNSPAANWYQSLGNTNTSNFKFSFENELNAARSKQKAILNTSSGVGQLAVNQSPFYNWLKTKSLNKGIL
jgi:hypothetical protein